MNLFEYAKNKEILTELHEKKHNKVLKVIEELKKEGKTEEQAKAEAEMNLLKPEEFNISSFVQKKDSDYKEVKIFLTNEEIIRIREFININEYKGLNIKSNFMMSVIDLLEDDVLKMKKNKIEVEFNEQ